MKRAYSPKEIGDAAVGREMECPIWIPGRERILVH